MYHMVNFSFARSCMKNSLSFDAMFLLKYNQIIIISIIIIIMKIIEMENILRNNTTKYKNKPHCNR